MLAFESDVGVASKIKEASRNLINTHYDNDMVNVDSLDNIICGYGVTYIKMDVEGAELPSLRGAQKVISTNLPRLAICIYHSDTDMIEIPEYVIENYPLYSIYIRQYSPGSASTILYAVADKN